MMKQWRKLIGGNIREADVDQVEVWIPLIATFVNQRLHAATSLPD
jgi:hypothetical protein